MDCDLPVGVFLDVLIEGVSPPADDLLLKFGVVGNVSGVYISLIIFCVEPDMVFIPLYGGGPIVGYAFFTGY